MRSLTRYNDAAARPDGALRGAVVECDSIQGRGLHVTDDAAELKIPKIGAVSDVGGRAAVSAPSLTQCVSVAF